MWWRTKLEDRPWGGDDGEDARGWRWLGVSWIILKRDRDNFGRELNVAVPPEAELKREGTR